jgi:hypothetical protein
MLLSVTALRLTNIDTT